MTEADELLRLVRAAKEQVARLERAGVVGLPIEKVRAGASTRTGTSTSTSTGTNVGAGTIARAPIDSAVPAPSGETLAQIRADLGDCRRCKLCDGRQNIVYGVGDPKASLVFVGEGPGADEDRTGEPFVGAAGQLLTKMIIAMGYTREQVYICNIVKCRPPGNRNPEPDEIAACEPFLQRQLAAIAPQMIVCLGKFAAQTLLQTDAPISRIRGNFHSYRGIPLMPTFHPAFLLRNPDAKRQVWDDLKLVMAELTTLTKV